MSVFSFIGGIILGAVYSVTALYFAYIKEDEKTIEAARRDAVTWESQARHWEAEAIRAKDNERIARKMQQYWRARCMNEHFEFNAACDGDGHYPTDNDAPTREEKLVSDIMDAIAVSSVTDEQKKDEAIPA